MITRKSFFRNCLLGGGLLTIATCTCLPEIVISTGSGTNGRIIVVLRDAAQPESDAQPVQLIGYSDAGILDEHTFDQVTFFKTLRQYGVNMVRAWVIYHWDKDYLPFAKTPDHSKWDLLKPSSRFFDRLATFISDADTAGIVVQLCLFDENAFDRQPLRWEESPYNHNNNADDTNFIAENAANNISRFFVTTAGTDKKRTIWDVNRMVITHTVAAVGAHSNVIYEIMNEPDSSRKLSHNDQHALTNFHAHVIAEIRAASPTAVVSVNIQSRTDTFAKWALDPNSGVDIVSVHLAPNTTPSDLPTAKPVIVSNDGHDTQSNLNFATVLAKRPKPDPRSLGTLMLLSDIFDVTNLIVGTRHFDFLDKDLMKKDHSVRGKDGNEVSVPYTKVTDLSQTTWQTTNYHPRAVCFDADILQTLQGFTRP
jgi:hypothetical protein